MNEKYNEEESIENVSEKSKNEQSDFTSIFTAKIKIDIKKNRNEKEDNSNKKNQLEKKLENQEDEKKQKYKENYEKVKEYVSGIDARVKEKYEELNKIKKEEKSIHDIRKIEKKKFCEPLKNRLEKHADILLDQSVMCNDKIFPVFFDQFTKEIDNKINNMFLIGKETEEYLQNKQQLNDFRESERGRFRLYKFFRNALYRQVYLLFYNTVRVISNVKIEYDLWHSDTWKHIWGVNSSANVYYKYRSSWDYRMFKFNLFYIEFSFGLFHLLLKPLKRISKWGSVLSFAGGDYFKKNGLNASEVPFWDMINISLVQISVGPVGINGLRFSLFDPIFFVMSLCLAKYLGLSDLYFSLGYMKNMFSYLTNYNAIISSPDKAAPKIYKLKKILKKFNFVEPGSYSAFINAFSSYLFKKSILFNIIETWKSPYNKHFYIDIVFYTFVEILKSAPDCFKEISSNRVKRRNTIHETKIIETYYFDGCVYTPLDKDQCSFRGRCDMFFLSLSLLLFSMIDSISIDLRWFIENESVRKYCAKLKRKVCRFFKN